MLFLSLNDFRFPGNLKMPNGAPPCCSLSNSSNKKRKIRTLHVFLKKISVIVIHTFQYTCNLVTRYTHKAFGEWVHRNVDFILGSHSASEGPEEKGEK